MNATLVKERAHYRCEVCGVKGEHVHHLFGRGHLIAEPIASHAAMTVYVCHRCHLQLHDSEAWSGDLTEVERWKGIQRCLTIWPLQLVGIDNPVDAARAIERAINAGLKDSLLRGRMGK